jgi:hypothetical protein
MIVSIYFSKKKGKRMVALNIIMQHFKPRHEKQMRNKMSNAGTP